MEAQKPEAQKIAKHLSHISQILDDLKTTCIEDAEKLIRYSGAIEDSLIDDVEGFALAKIVVSAVLERNKFNYLPLSPEYKKLVKNLIKV